MSGPCALPLPSLQSTYSVQCDGSGSSPDAFRECISGPLGKPAMLAFYGSVIWRVKAMFGLVGVLKLTAGG